MNLRFFEVKFQDATDLLDRLGMADEAVAGGDDEFALGTIEMGGPVGDDAV